MSGPSQPKVEDEQWSDDRIKGFLELKPCDDTHPDFHVLKEAYQHMTAPFFARFIPFFKASGRDINALNLMGQTLLGRIEGHGRSRAYVDILKDNGAQ